VFVRLENLSVLKPIEMLQTTLTFFRQKSANKILLAMKKRGFGIGKWNGPYLVKIQITCGFF
jgi:hypothetical protein